MKLWLVTPTSSITILKKETNIIILQSPPGSRFAVHPQFSGYNGKAWKFDMKINMGPTQPLQRKGRLPQYSKEKLQILQDKCNDMEALGVLRKPDEINITVEYLNPSFLNLTEDTD